MLTLRALLSVTRHWLLNFIFYILNFISFPSSPTSSGRGLCLAFHTSRKAKSRFASVVTITVNIIFFFSLSQTSWCGPPMTCLPVCFTLDPLGKISRGKDLNSVGLRRAEDTVGAAGGKRLDKYHMMMSPWHGVALPASTEYSWHESIRETLGKGTKHMPLNHSPAGGGIKKLPWRPLMPSHLWEEGPSWPSRR